jgi:hypothetical protein
VPAGGDAGPAELLSARGWGGPGKDVLRVSHCGGCGPESEGSGYDTDMLRCRACIVDASMLGGGCASCVGVGALFTPKPEANEKKPPLRCGGKP